MSAKNVRDIMLPQFHHLATITIARSQRGESSPYSKQSQAIPRNSPLPVITTKDEQLTMYKF
jgi:hypothetical protein